MNRLLLCLALPALPPSAGFAQDFAVWQSSTLSTGGTTGSQVGGVGDIDGDGVPDFFVTPVSGDSGPGEVRVYSGAIGLVLLYLTGTASLEGFGQSVAGVGDQNGDGTPDLLVGAPGADPGGVANAGRVTVHSGAGGGVLLTLDGPAAGAGLGSAQAGAGDLDGDGVEDLLVAGNAAPRVYSGQTGSLLFTLAVAPLSVASVAGIGDVDSDGVPDLLVGTPYGGIGNPGQASVFTGSAGALLLPLAGVGPGDAFGSSVAGVGDLTGDGVPDFAVGAPQFSVTGAGGYAQVFSGAAGAPALFLAGAAPSALSGASLAGPGDLDGDTVPDVVVGSPGANQARVYSGATGAILQTLQGPAPGSQYGFSVAGIGDQDGDGASEVAVGFAGASAYARVHSGATGAVMSTLFEAAPGDGFGTSIAATRGSFSSPLPGVAGVPGLLVGNPGGGAARAGEVRVFSQFDGTPLGTLGGAAPLDRFGLSLAPALLTGGIYVGPPSFVVGAPQSEVAGAPGYANVYQVGMGYPAPLFVLLGANPQDGFGHSVAGDGDVNGNFLTDLLVGAPQIRAAGGPATGPGYVRVFSGTNGGLLRTLSGASTGDGFGWSVAFAGDLNGDGASEILVGAPFADPGGVPDAGVAAVFSGANGALLLVGGGSAPSDLFGYSVAGVGDANGDGVPDLLVGAPQSGAGVSPGYARLHSGAGGGLLLTVTGSAPAARFGSSVAGAGDVNGDGSPDLVVGSAPGPAGAPGPGLGVVYSGSNGSPLFTVSESYLSGGDLRVAGAADPNADGFAEFAVGEPLTGGGGTLRVVSYVGVPGGSALFGLPCFYLGNPVCFLPSSLWFPRIGVAGGYLSSATGNPSAGISLSLTCGTGAAAVLLLGTSPLSPSLSLPGFPGLPGPSCLVSVLPVILVALPVQSSAVGGGFGTAVAPMPLPANPTLVGTILYAQWAVVPSSGGLGMSQPMLVWVGP